MLKIYLLKYRTIYATLFVILAWYLLHLSIQSNIIPNPIRTIIVFFQLLQEDLLLHLLVSLGRIIVSVGIAVIIGTVTGLFLGMHEKYDIFFGPVIYLLYPLPKIAFLPVFMILFGLGNTSKIVLITTIILFQILVTTRDSVKGLSKEIFYSIRSLGATKWQVYQHVVIPAILPKLFTALRISVGTSISVLFFAENYATTYGIGYFIMDSWIRVDYIEMFAGIIAISLLGLFVFKMIDLLEKNSCKWALLEKNESQSLL
ncbi:Putative aliphatic sulfonates transport permease protein SsuC [Paraliobacillus sp. PM-2]|uniref:ABC transporter permease n=1 Tax=Paraliobacillus sp. PM-2 TaxID=1462524 RepID=UPI00061BB42D|nr:ABC transporter permease [Paraliobacillus sp. PM-2]CQR47906.1 Putative aliphatic sulfonates transport permease protein SsuC [Paraliobacillus sp. PM-2]